MNTNRIHDHEKRDLNILIIDDDITVLKTITRILQLADVNYFIETANCVKNAIEFIEKTYWDTILLDLSLPVDANDVPDTKNGLNLLVLLKHEYNLNTPIIAITGHYEDDLSDDVLDKGAYYFLNKPLRPKYIAAIVKNSTRFQLSGFDGLTGLLNRVTFEERLQSEFVRTKRKNDSTNFTTIDNISYLSLLFFDCDNFKKINDNFSHLKGDMLLKRIGRSFFDETIYTDFNGIIKSKSFIMRPYDLVSRFGGDEFCIFLPETDHDNAYIVANRIKSVFNRIVINDILGEQDNRVNDLKLSFSIGVATYPLPTTCETYEDLISAADLAMYASKTERVGDIFGYNRDQKIINLDKEKVK